MKKGCMEGLPQNSGQPTAQGPLLFRLRQPRLRQPRLPNKHQSLSGKRGKLPVDVDLLCAGGGSADLRFLFKVQTSECKCPVRVVAKAGRYVCFSKVSISPGT